MISLASKIVHAIIVTLVIISCGQLSYKEFIPIYFSEEGLREEKDSLTLELTRNIQQVFKYYKIDYKVEGGRVFYRGNIDKELLWNYTSRAKDIEWLRTHEVKNKANNTAEHNL